MKKTILFILFVFMLVSCSSSVGETNTIPGSSGLDHVDPIGGITQYTSENADPDNELVIEATVEYLPVYETEIELKLIGRVVSVDGCDNYWADYGYGGIYTYGKIEVIKPLKGEISEGDIIGFAIGGERFLLNSTKKARIPRLLRGR